MINLRLVGSGKCVGLFQQFSAALMLVGCASKSSDIAPSYVSPMQYDACNCQHLAEEAKRVSAHAAEAAGAQDSQATRDAVVTTAAVVVFWPAAFWLVATSRMLPSLPVYVDRWTRSSRHQFARNVGFNSGKLRRVMRIAELGGEAPTPRLRGGAAPLRRPRGRPGHHGSRALTRFGPRILAGSVSGPEDRPRS
jgi:hypothetical protein